MSLVTSYRDRTRGRPDSEHSQALLRTVIVSVLLLNTAWAAEDPADVAPLWAINLFSVGFSVALLVRVLARPHASPRRRIAGAIHDNVAATAWLYICGPVGALLVFVYPFVTVGNGFRFGVRYLIASGLLGALGMGTLVVSAPEWRRFGVIGAGLLLSHVVVTIYTGALLARLQRAQGQLEDLATRDPLTGLPNRRSFMDRLSQSASARGDARLACLYLDLDGFKSVNDRCGHEVGDLLLHRVAEEALGCIRASDLLARLGGDEFAVVLDGAPSDDVVTAVAERIVAAVDGITEVGGHAVDVSVSIGVAFASEAEAGTPGSSEALVRAADEAMYAAKRSGKGCFRFAAAVPDAA